ncbi:HAD hydrolase-like protein [Alloyangia pacifica]|uniref:Phosphoglycolate phosphatase n=1 Tax=Alloyangia pacifica TaxID=311180 RepID=A0A1I6S2J7_9RHOB|nr:HAD hydrolase-like protein [Alloyangia pacifica]SDG69659.1 phosphoglycolate phosphatase [Alloyangia pacifica]SFS71162.1 phosphoglycolate phosphatase [Alloyangia pacifica]
MDKFVLFDLDGTLVDPAPGIIGAFKHALFTLGQPVPADEALHWVIGPPLRESFARMLGASDRVEEAVALYREVYGETGLFEAEPYAGIPEVLTDLRDAGYRLFLCTAKPLPFARRVVAHFGLDPWFEALYGAELGGRFDDKADLIAHILKEQGFSAGQGVMVGDRDNDTHAAKRNDMASVGVLWGYGSRAELVETGATVLCDTPAAILPSIEALLIR